MKKIWIALGVVLLIVSITVMYNWDRVFTSILIFQEPKVEKSDWSVISSISSKDTTHVLKVTYQEKYGIEKQVTCMIIFENTKTAEYKCVSPWLDLILQKSNLNSFKSEKIEKTKDE